MSSCCSPCLPVLAPKSREVTSTASRTRFRSHDSEISVEEHSAASALLTKVDGSNEDIVAAAGLNLPWQFKTPFRRWVCLWVFSLVGAFAAGPMTMWPTLEPILVQEHVFEGRGQLLQLTEVFSVGLGFMMFSTLLVGLVYDIYGPRFCAVIGSFAFAITAVGMGIAIEYRSLNWLLYCVYPVSIMLGYGKNYGAYAYQWLLPESQNTVNSVINATQALSDALVLGVVWLHHSYQIQLWTYFYGLSIFAIVSGIVMAAIVPSRKENLEYAAAIVTYFEMAAAAEGAALAGEAAGAADYGSVETGDAAPDPPQIKRSKQSFFSRKAVEDILETGDDKDAPVTTATVSPVLALADEDEPVKSSGWRFLDNLKAVLNCMRQYPTDNALFLGGCCALYMSTWYPTMQMYNFYDAMFGAAEATNLVNMFAVIYGFLGAVATIVGGRIVDWLGLKKAMGMVCFLVVLLWVTLMIPTVRSQLICQVVLTVEINLFQVLAMRFCMLYAPPVLFGTYVGVVLTLFGLSQVLVTSITGIISSYTTLSEVLIVRCAGSLFSIACIACFTALILYWERCPPPIIGAVTRRQVGLPEESAYPVEDGGKDESWL